MSSLFERGLHMAARALPRAAGGRIRYIRGDTSSVWIDATFGQQDYEVETVESVRIEHVDRDFLFAVDDLILGGTLATPERGDRIQVEHGDMYEVLPIGGEKCYRTAGPGADGNDVMYRVHAKRVSK